MVAPVVPWRQAEFNAAAWMRALGFNDAQVTKATGDGGVDVVATGAVAQVKWQSQRVGRPAIQALRGAAFTVPNALFFSLSGYSRGAIDEANANGVALFEMINGQPSAVNAAAAQLLRRSQGRRTNRRSRRANPVAFPSVHPSPPSPAPAVIPVAPPPMPAPHAAPRSAAYPPPPPRPAARTGTGDVAHAVAVTARLLARAGRAVWAWPIWRRPGFRRGVAAAFIGTLPAAVLFGLLEALFGPWETSEETPGVVTALLNVVWAVGGFSVWRWLDRRAKRRASATSEPPTGHPGVGDSTNEDRTGHVGHTGGE